MAPGQVPHDAARADELARALNDVVAAIDQARSVGLPVEVPEQLYRACAEVISRREGSGPPGGSGARSTSRRAPRSAAGEAAHAAGAGPSRNLPIRDHASVHDVPLRRLLWQVLDPGEEFTVNEVVERLATIGVQSPANAVSNALGYWVSRQRLARIRKGVYLYPIIVDPASNAYKAEADREIPTGDQAASRRRETSNGSVHEVKKKAM